MLESFRSTCLSCAIAFPMHIATASVHRTTQRASFMSTSSGYWKGQRTAGKQTAPGKWNSRPRLSLRYSCIGVIGKKLQDLILDCGDTGLLRNQTSCIRHEVVYDFTAGTSRCKDFRDTFRSQPLDLSLGNVSAAYHENVFQIVFPHQIHEFFNLGV